MRGELLRAVDARFADIRCTNYTVATALDPRHKLMYFSAAEVQECMNQLRILIERPQRQIQSDSQERDNEQDEDGPTTPKRRNITGFWDCFEMASTQAQHSTSTSTSASESADTVVDHRGN